MKASALNLLTAIAMATTASVSFAQQQQATDANASPATTSPDGTKPADRVQMERTAPYYQGGVAYPSGCSGLSDRQTERACRQGLPVDHADMPNSMGSDRGGKSDDQAS
jgi:hypothetical protein